MDMGNLSNDGHHATASGNDLSTTSVVNYIYLLADSGSNPFNSWMEKIGSRLHLASDQTSLKPIVDLLITAISPERIFVISYKGIPQYQIDDYTEILLMIDDAVDTAEDQNMNFVKLAFAQNRDIFISLGDATEIEGHLEFGSPYYCSHFRNWFQVYSAGPTRIIEMHQDQMDKLKSETSDRFQALFSKAQILYNNAADFFKQDNPDLGASLLYQALLMTYQSIITAFKGPIPEIYSAVEYQKVAKRYLPLITSNDRLGYLPEKLEETCSLQGQRNYQISKGGMDLLAADVQTLMEISQITFASKLKQFDSPPA